MKVALVSLDQHWLDKGANIKRCTQHARTAADHGCSMVVFPEMTLTGYSLEMGIVAEPYDGSPTMASFDELARGAKIDILFGAVFTDPAATIYHNTICLARRAGGTSVIYKKMHPFSFARENEVIMAGNDLGMVDLGELKLGCSLCYDLRFPELYSLMAPRCNSIVNIANWPAARAAHWRTLLTARAIENQLFVFGVNRIGVDGNGHEYEKSSMVIGPDGAVLKGVFSGPEIDVYSIDAADVDRCRSSFPIIRDKRYGLYRELYREVQC